ncbi:DUF305 domain-containing protein [Actinophytocola sp.]|uniref:DUF305 domain-containing protein n=1 Tax=Actinophytocola sp. TaxID=1872138 RepID=UPI003D6AC94F
MTRTSRTAGPDPRRRRLAAGVGVLLAAGAFAACSAEEPPPPANSAPVIVPGKPGEPASTIPPGEATPLEEEAPNDADVAFVRDMIVHHGQAVEMADLAPNRAPRDDVAGLADRIADTQRSEIDMLNRWLELHGHEKVDPAGHGDAHAGMPGMATPQQMRALREARGARFDTLFLQLMVTHHEGALTMVEDVRTSGVNVRVQEIADDVAVTQSDEIHRMRGMLGS